MFRLTSFARVLLVIGAGLSAAATVGMTSPAAPSLPGSVLHVVTEEVEPAQADPPDPYHVAVALVTPPRRSKDHWYIVGSDGAEQAAHIVVRAPDGVVSQVAHRDDLAGVEMSWWPAMGRTETAKLPTPIQLFEPKGTTTARMAAQGYVEVGRFTVAGRAGVEYERVIAGPDGASIRHRILLSTEPEGMVLREARVARHGNGTEDQLYSYVVRQWDTLPAGSGPVELRAWAPPSGSRATRSPSGLNVANSAAASARDTRAIERDAGFRLVGLGPDWQLANAWHLRPSVAVAAAADDGGYAAAELTGQAVALRFQPPAGRPATLTIARRGIALARLQRTPPAWDAAWSRVIRVEGRDRLVWFVRRTVGFPPEGLPSDAGRWASTAAASARSPTTTAIVDLDDILVVAMFAGLDPDSAAQAVAGISTARS